MSTFYINICAQADSASFSIFVGEFSLRAELPVWLTFIMVSLIISCLNLEPHTSSSVPGHGRLLTRVSVTFHISLFDAYSQMPLCAFKTPLLRIDFSTVIL